MTSRRTLAALFFPMLFVALAGCTGGDALPRGPYLGQSPPLPGGEAELFAPDQVSTGLYTRDLTMTPDGREIYFCVVLGNFAYATIMVTRQDADGRWSQPEVLPFAANPAWIDLEPHISPDGRRLFFMSDRPRSSTREAKEQDTDIWVAEREGESWGTPRNLGAPVNSEASEYFPSSTHDGVLYFTREDSLSPGGAIFRARPLPGGGYATPERLGEAVNSTPNVFNAFVDPEERFLIVPTFGREDSRGRTDYYVCFPDGNGGWEGPYNLGDRVNTTGGLEYSASTSPDGRLLFFMAARPEGEIFGAEGMSREAIWKAHASPGNGSPNVYWIDSEVIAAARPVP